jgi:hypothetical protein
MSNVTLYCLIGGALSVLWTCVISRSIKMESVLQFVLTIGAVFIFWPLIAARFIFLGLIFGPIVFKREE